MFESRQAARKYRRENDQDIEGRIKKDSDGSFAIINRANQVSYQDIGEGIGVQAFTTVTPNDFISGRIEGERNSWDGGNEHFVHTLRDGSEVDGGPTVVGGIAPNAGPGKGSKLSISAIKKALKEVHKAVGKLPKGTPGKWGSNQRGNKLKGYRLDKEGHPNSTNPNEKGPHINWWDWTKGKWNKGKGPGRKGAEPIE